MDVRLLHDAEAFLAEAGPLLLEDEARNNLILGDRRHDPSPRPTCFAEQRFWVVADDRRDGRRRTAHAAVQPRPRAPRRRRRRSQTLAGGIDEELPGVVGAHPEVDDFAESGRARTRSSHASLRDQGVYALERVAPVPRRAGAVARRRRGRPRAVCSDWCSRSAPRCSRRATPAATEAERRRREPPRRRRRRLRALGGRRRGRLRLRLGRPDAERHPRSARSTRRPSCAAGATRPRSSPSSRRHSSTRGRRFCFLYTDLANPTSNAIYERIGYRPRLRSIRGNVRPDGRACALARCA